MNVIDTFYILFKSNADDAKRSMTDMDKVTKESEKNFKNATEASDQLGRSFVKMVEAGSALAGAYVGFNFVKNGVLQQTEYNKQLYVTSQLYRQNAGELKAFAQAAAQSGGSREGALTTMTGLAALANTRGLQYDPMKQMMAARDMYKRFANNPAAQASMLYGPNAIFQDQGLARMMQMGDTEFNALMSSKGVRAAGSLTNDQARKAFEAEQAGEDLKGSMGKLDTTIATGLIPTLQTLIGWISGGASSLGNSFGGALVGAGAVIGGTAIKYGVGGAVGSKLLGWAGRNAGNVAKTTGRFGVGADAASTYYGAESVAAGAGAGLLTVGGAVLAGVGEIGYGAYKLYELWAPYLKSKFGSMHQGKLAQNYGGNDMDFWTSQGYSRDQAAGILANMQKESGGNPNAIGDNGKAKGLFQWHKARRDAILAGTGIDVWNASKSDQLKAAAWEMQHGNAGFNDKAFRSLIGADNAGAYFSANFERPAGGLAEAFTRGRAALGIASSYGAVGGGKTEVNIGKIEIHTQATDSQQIAQHIKSAVIGACSEVQAKIDNGRAG